MSATWLRSLWHSRAAEVRQDYARAFDGMQGKRLLRDLAEYCNVGSSSFVAGDPYQTAFREGQRDVFNHIAGILGLKPDAFPQALETDE